MTSPARRIADLEPLVSNRQPDGPPTWCFFAVAQFQAQANYGGDPPDVVLEDIEDVERVIAAYDEIRREHRLDLIDTAVLIARHAFSDESPSASGIAGMPVEAFWHWDPDRPAGSGATAPFSPASCPLPTPQPVPPGQPPRGPGSSLLGNQALR